MNKIIILFLSFFMINNLSAESMLSSGSGPFYLEDEILGPKSFRYILLKTLPRDRAYNITCDIENPNYMRPNPVVIQVQVAAKSYYSLGQYLLNVPKITITAKNVIPTDDYSKLIVTNYDDADLIFIKRCMAKYATN